MDHKRALKRRNILYLIEAFLTDNNYKITSDCLKSEAKLTTDYQICDNINLETIIVDFETFYFQRFSTYPQLCKKIVNDNTNKNRIFRKNYIASPSYVKMKQETEKASIDDTSDLVVQNSIVHGFKKCDSKVDCTSTENDWSCDYPWKEYSDFVLQNVCLHGMSVRWDDVKGLEDVKELLKEAVIYPIKYSHFFGGTVERWKSILLYGPPGTGKTLLAKAAATESSATFFNVSSSSLISKWRGDTEKLIKVLFETALQKTPSIIFIDEVDSLTYERSIFEHEASRRMKSEIFAGIDRLLETNNNVVLLASTNIPWTLDKAMLRRFEKHVYIPYPDEKTRKLLFEYFLPNVISQQPFVQTEIDYDFIAQETENFSGSDIKNLCKEIKMHCIRGILFNLESKGSAKKNINSNTITKDQIRNMVTKKRPIITHSQGKYLHWKTSNGDGNELNSEIF